MSEPLFSVVIPTYNRAPFLKKTITSVLQQRYKHFEILVVDDGSTDNTSEVIEEIQDTRLTYYKKQNGERGAARNYGIDRAKGDYITFLDSDDLWKMDCLELASQFVEKDSAGIFHLGYDIAKPDGEIVRGWKNLPGFINDTLIDGNCMSCLGVFLKREVLAHHRFNEDRQLSGSEDYELWLRLAARYRIKAYPISVATLVQHEDRSVLNQNPDSLLLRIELLHKTLINDTAFLTFYRSKMRQLEGTLKLYTSLHLSLMPGLKLRAIRELMRGTYVYPMLIFKFRFWVIIKKIVID